MNSRLLSLLFVFGLALLPVTASAAETIPYDVQCWRGIGLTEGPPPGSLAALVEQCVESLQLQDAVVLNTHERELRKKYLLARARTQAAPLLRVRSVLAYKNNLIPIPVRQQLPSVAERAARINMSHQQHLRRKQWVYLPEDLRTRALTTNRVAARECLVRIDIPLEQCAREAIASGLESPQSAVLPAAYQDQQQITLSLNQLVVSTEGITVQLLRVIDDSRCLVGIHCLWSGEASISARIFSQKEIDANGEPTDAAPRTLTITATDPNAFAAPAGANTVTVGRCTVAFVRLLPYPTVLRSVEELDMSATFVIVNPGRLFSCAP